MDVERQERMVDVTVVMPVRDAGRTIGAQMRALADQEYDGEWELVVLDNRSTDDSMEVVAREGGAIPRLRTVDASAAVGAAAVRNRGIELAHGRKIVFCDADDVVAPGWLAAMSRALDVHDAAVGRVRVERLNSPSVCAWRSQGLDRGLNRWPGFLHWGISANLGASSAALRAVAGFDASFPTSAGEDVDLCWRLQFAGYTLGFANDAVVDYRMRDTWTESLTQAYRYAMAEAFLYRKHHDRGMPRRGPVMAVKVWLRGLLDLSKARHRDARVRALRSLAKSAGRLHGSFRNRVFYP